ncbi:MAG: ester cyclase [Acidobacteriota bacterium]
MEQSNMNLKVVQRFYDAYNKKQEAILNEIISSDYVDYGHQPPGRGVQGAKSDYQAIASGFDDVGFDIDEMFGSDDRVVARWTMHGTHTGQYAGLSPTQKKIEVQGVSVYRLRDGKITETRNLADLLALFTQLGAIQQLQNVAS